MSCVQCRLPDRTRLGLRYSKLHIVPSAGEHLIINVNALERIGCKVRLDRSVAVMKSPMGTATFCTDTVSKRVQDAT